MQGNDAGKVTCTLVFCARGEIQLVGKTVPAAAEWAFLLFGTAIGRNWHTSNWSASTGSRYLGIASTLDGPLALCLANRPRPGMGVVPIRTFASPEHLHDSRAALTATAAGAPPPPLAPRPSCCCSAACD